MKSLALTIFAAVSLSGCASTGTTRSEASAAPEFSLATLTTATQILSSDRFEGRAPTTPGEERTVEYLAERFQQAGLQPGNNGSWYQNVPLVETTATPTALRITGGNAPITFNYRTDMVANTYQVQPRVSVENSDIVFVGYGINAPERNWNDYAGLDVRGKTVIILVNDPDWQSQSLEGTFNGRAMTYYGRWTYKYEEAARQGAAAAFIVHDTAPASYGWNVVQSSWTGAQYNMDDPGNHMDQSRVIGWLTLEAAGRLFADSGLDLAALREQAGRPGFRAVPLRSRASISLTNQIRRSESRNVVGILPGRTRPDEYVIYTAHWDHLGRCDADSTGDDICNGATDNASGTAGLIALAEAHARAGPPERSIVFLAVTAEESGLLGSRYYGENPIYPLARTVGGINMDSLSLNGDARDMVSIGGNKSALDAVLRRAAAAEALTLRPEPSPEAGYYYRSDHFSLARVGVPMLYPKLGEDLVNGGPAAGRAAAQDYRANRYHQPSDEYDPAWDWTGALHELRIFYRIGRDLADGNDWPNWYEGDEFRAIRDRSPGQAVNARQPPEWAPHEFVWIGFPSHAELWEDDLEAAREEVAAFARAVHANGKGEEARLVAADPELAEVARRLAPFATVVEQRFGDIWLRDTGPLILTGDDGRAARSFRFNGWGGKYELEGDDTLAPRLAETIGLEAEEKDWILEGGAIDVDGTGLAVTTEQCLLNPNRNPGMTRPQVEARLREDLGIERLLWLGNGLAADHTDGHVDNLARFVGEGVLAVPVPESRADPNSAAFGDARYRAESFGLQVAPLPSPGRVEQKGEVVAASYMNFYIGNEAVVVPLYGAANDEAAVELVQGLFPDRKAVGLRADHVLTGGGSFHCISQQVPK